MAQKTAPAFRKSMRGYKKTDVNNYILQLNRTLEDNKAAYERSLEGCNARAEADYQRICELSQSLKEQENKNRDLLVKIDELSPYETRCAEQEDEISRLRERIAILEANEEAAKDNDEKAKAEYYDSICSKAGEILFIASGTAESILNRANVFVAQAVNTGNSIIQAI